SGRVPGTRIQSRQVAADDDGRTKRICNDVTISLRRDRSPVAERNFAVIATTFDPDRPAFLLAAVKPVRKRVVRADVIQLCRRLVVPRAPTLSAVHGNDRALIRAQQNDVGIIRIDPNILIIVATGRAAPAVPGLAAVRRFPTNDTG